MAAAPMIRFFLRMALVLFSFSLVMLLFVDRGTEEHTLTLYSLGMTGTFAAALALWLRTRKRDQQHED